MKTKNCINMVVKNCDECPMLDWFEYASCSFPNSPIKPGFDFDFDLAEGVHPECPLLNIDEISIRLSSLTKTQVKNMISRK